MRKIRQRMNGVERSAGGEDEVRQRKRRSRENTIDEKRRMRQNRKKRKRMRSSQVSRINVLEKEVDQEQRLRKESEMKVVHYRGMARSYWERWRWELNQRKEAMLQERAGRMSTAEVPHLLEIDHTLLHDTTNDGSEIFVGQGSFGVVKMKIFRGIKVAVKELQPKTLLSDMKNEAYILAKLCHPFLPYLFGVCTVGQPYRIIMQFHGIKESTTSLTLSSAIVKNRITDGYAWLGIGIQIMQALSYLHNEVQILHNDITSSNICLTDSVTEKPSFSDYIQIVLIDFGKATSVNNSRKYKLSDTEKVEYTRRYPQIAPEVVDGVTTLTTWSDMYSAGHVIQFIIDHDFFVKLPRDQRDEIQSIVNKCHCLQYQKRLSAKQALQSFQQLMTDL